jgi:hypothetical protein
VAKRWGTHYDSLPHGNCSDPAHCDCDCAGCVKDRGGESVDDPVTAAPSPVTEDELFLETAARSELIAALRAAWEERDRLKWSVGKIPSVESGICHCGEEMEDHSVYSEHSPVDNPIPLHMAYTQEREARKQAEVEQFNAGIEAAADIVRFYMDQRDLKEVGGLVAYQAGITILERITALSKSVSGSPERLEVKP